LEGLGWKAKALEEHAYPGNVVQEEGCIGDGHCLGQVGEVIAGITQALGLTRPLEGLP
jgi:hypothetical protein